MLNRFCLSCLVPIGFLLITATPVAQAVVWSNRTAQPPTEQIGAMKHAGRMLYSPLHVFGGSCIWVGGKWILTARHGVKGWSNNMLKVDFPAHGEQRYSIHAIHLPPDAGVDLALLELQELPEFDNPITLDSHELANKVQVKFGGYGNYGPAGNIAGMNRFHWGTNTLEGSNKKLARFKLGEPDDENPHEAIPASFDSGSPVFQLDDGHELLVGVVIRVSHGSAPNIGDRATLTCLAEQVDWIQSIAKDLNWRN